MAIGEALGGVFGTIIILSVLVWWCKCWGYFCFATAAKVKAEVNANVTANLNDQNTTKVEDHLDSQRFPSTSMQHKLAVNPPEYTQTPLPGSTRQYLTQILEEPENALEP